MPNVTFGDRLKIARKAVTGLFSERSATEAFGLLSGIYPSGNGPMPERGTKEILQGYSKMPWLRAVSSKVAYNVAATDWVLMTPTSGKRDKLVQRAMSANRKGMIAKAVEGGTLKPVPNHILLDALATANEFLVGQTLFVLTQVHLDLVGEAFWIKERNGVGAPVGFWPIPPHWVRETPTVTRRSYRVSWSGWQGEIPDTEVVWFCDPDPANPYGRGSGLARTLADELETDEYAARHTRMTFLNRARPDLIIWPEETKHDAGTISPENAQRLGEKWRAEHQGFWRAALPFFSTRKLGIKELSQNFQELQLIDLRKHERDIIIQTFGMPPEELGIVESSNRATAEAAEFIFKKNVIVPRLEFLRAYIQERLVPEYDERLVIDYVSPVSEDREFNLKVATVAPWSLTADEWRAFAGREPLADDKGLVHMIQSTLVPVTDLTDVPRPLAVDSKPEPATPTKRAIDLGGAIVGARAAATDEWHEALAACRDAADAPGATTIAKALSDDEEDLPELSKRVGRQESAVRRLVAGRLDELRTGTSLDALERAVALVEISAREQAVLAAVPLAAWQSSFEADAIAFLVDAFLVGAKVGAEAAGVQLRAPQSLPFNSVNPEAVAWAQQYAATLVTNISQATLDGIRAAVVDALNQGWSARTMARVIRDSVGLTAQQSAAVARFAAKLAGAEADFTDEQLFARVGRYANAQRRLRALNIARTELATASGVGQQRLWNMALANGALKKGAMKKTWLVAHDELLCPQCEALAGEVVDVTAAFSNGVLQPPAHVDCRCASGLVPATKKAQRIAVVRSTGETRALIETAVRAGFAPLADALDQLN